MKTAMMTTLIFIGTQSALAEVCEMGKTQGTGPGEFGTQLVCENQTGLYVDQDAVIKELEVVIKKSDGTTRTVIAKDLNIPNNGIYTRGQCTGTPCRKPFNSKIVNSMSLAEGESFEKFGKVAYTSNTIVCKTSLSNGVDEVCHDEYNNSASRYLGTYTEVGLSSSINESQPAHFSDCTKNSGVEIVCTEGTYRFVGNAGLPSQVNQEREPSKELQERRERQWQREDDVLYNGRQL